MYDPESETVTIIKNYTNFNLSLIMLSNEDQKWVLAAHKKYLTDKAAAEAPSVEEQLAKQEVGSKLNSKTLVKLDGKRFKRSELEFAPEYYLLYYTASW